MEKIKVALIAIVAVLLVIQIVDRSRQPEQLHAVQESLDRLNATLQRATLSAPSTVGTATGGATAPVEHPVVDASRDGKPKLGANFLLPYDASSFHPEWLRGTLVYFDPSPKGLNPIIDNSTEQADAEALTNDTLCSKHPAHPELWSENLATSVVISDDYRTYTFAIRHGVMWQRPAIAKQKGYEWLDRDVELTARDFVFYIDTVRDPQVECPQLKAYYEDDLDKAEAVDDYTLRLTWKNKVYTSLDASMGLLPLPRHVYTKNRDGSDIPAERFGSEFNHHWFDEEHQSIGVGAYTLDRYAPDKEISFRRNPAYWGATLNFEAIRWDGEVKKPDPQLVAFKNGQAHFISLSPTQYKSEILDHHEPRFASFDPKDPKHGRTGELGWERVRGPSYTYIGWNMRKDLFRDKRVRQAMTMAFPKQRIIDEVYFGLGRPQIANVHPDSPYFNHDLKPYPFDPQAAKKLLADAGWTDSDGDGVLDHDAGGGARIPFKFQLKYIANSPEWDSTLLIFKNELHAIGVEMEPLPLEWKELIRVYEDKDFDAVAGGWRFGLDVDFYQLWHSKYANEPRSSNSVGFVNHRADELAEKLRATFDLDERIRIAREFQAIIYDEQPYTFFRSSEGIFAWQNLGENRDGQERYLDGVIKGLDEFHPLFSREKLYWHFRQ